MFRSLAKISPFFIHVATQGGLQKTGPIRWFSGSTAGLHDSCWFYILTGLKGLTGPFPSPVELVSPVRVSKPCCKGPI